MASPLGLKAGVDFEAVVLEYRWQDGDAFWTRLDSNRVLLGKTAVCCLAGIIPEEQASPVRRLMPVRLLPFRTRLSAQTLLKQNYNLHGNLRPEGEMDALLIIDMQVEAFEEDELYDAKGVVERINNLASNFRDQGWPVIFIQHDGTKQSCFIPGSDGWKLVPGLTALERDFYVNKRANDSFYHTDLQKILQSSSVDRLFVTGNATDFCVNATVHSALVKDYNVVVIGDCHTTGDRPGISAKQLIDFHNMLWPNLAPTGGKVEVKYSRELF